MNIIFDTERIDYFVRIIEWTGLCSAIQCCLLLAILVALCLKQVRPTK